MQKRQKTDRQVHQAFERLKRSKFFSPSHVLVVFVLHLGKRSRSYILRRNGKFGHQRSDGSFVMEARL